MMGRTTPFSSGRALRSCFVVQDRSGRCAFDVIENAVPADADEGGLAKLFLAKTDDGTTVAIKRFHAVRGFDQALFEQHCAMARVEYQRLLELDGACGYAPEVYALGSFFDENGCEHVAIAMEYVEGYTLDYALRAGFLGAASRKRDRVKTSIQVGQHIARALEACKPCVHRDLSPRNVMVVMDDKGVLKRVVLIDFGQAAHTVSSLVTPSVGPHRLATVSFGAPEVFGGSFYHLRNDPSVDVYSLGALLYYMATWRIPFLELSATDAASEKGARVIVEAKRSPLDYLGAVEGTVREEERALARLVEVCTAYDPRVRPDAVTALREMEGMLTSASAARSAGRTGRACTLTPVWNSGSGPAGPAGASGTSAGESDAQTPAELLVLSDNCFYGHGGMTRDVERSYRALAQAAQLGSAEAQFRLGKSLALGYHGIMKPVDARSWLSKATEAGHPGAASTLRALAL